VQESTKEFPLAAELCDRWATSGDGTAYRVSEILHEEESADYANYADLILDILVRGFWQLRVGLKIIQGAATVKKAQLLRKKSAESADGSMQVLLRQPWSSLG
jgi:hypothetical protein